MNALVEAAQEGAEDDAAIVVVDGDQVELTDDVQDEPPDPFAEEAEKYGWVPEDKFTGEGKHMSARAFMERGPGTSRKAMAEVEALKKQQTEAEKVYATRLERMEKAMQAKADAEVETRVQQITRAKLAAVEDGDVERYQKLVELEKESSKSAKAPAEAIPEAERVAIENWRQDNQWFGVMDDATDEAGKYYARITANGTDPDKALDLVTKFISVKFPGLVEPPQAAAPKAKVAAVDSGGSRRPAAKAQGWGDIPAEDRAIAKKQIDRGEWDTLAKSGNTTPEMAFAKEYWSQ